MKILEIYEKYKIMPQLQTHMLRVAGVASRIVDNFQKPIDKNSIISACLLHDMGNIIKADLELFPEYLKDKGIQYWKSVQKEFVEKFGNSDHLATYKICKEVGIDSKIFNLIKGFGFAKTEETYKSQNIMRKICVYSDLRVSPHQVEPLEKRLEEARVRYLSKKKIIYTKEQFDKFIPMWSEIEKQIFKYCRIKPAKITEEKVKPIIERLKDFEIKTNL